jgi:tetratricopeptide (TPR) repeat protein
MRSVFPYLIAVLLAGAHPAVAQEPPMPEVEGPLPPATEPVEPAEPLEESAEAGEENRLDKLFADLKRERNEKAAERIANFIQEEWSKSGSASIDLMMQWSGKAMQEKKFDVALDFLDQVTMLAPDFAEGWNRRATVHFMMDSYGKSMSDIQRTLRLEPRHFGALSGMAAISKIYDRKQAALDAYVRVLEIYPMLRSAQEEVGRLSEELAGEGI